AHDHEHLASVDGDLAGATAPGQARPRPLVRPDHRRVDVAESVDLGGSQEPDVDQATLEVVAEQLEHADDRGRAGDDRRIADAEWQALWPRPEDASLIDQLERRRDGPLGEVHRDVRQADADEADTLPLQGPRGGHDHHLGAAEGLDPHAMSSMDEYTALPSRRAVSTIRSAPSDAPPMR